MRVQEIEALSLRVYLEVDLPGPCLADHLQRIDGIGLTFADQSSRRMREKRDPEGQSRAAAAGSHALVILTMISAEVPVRRDRRPVYEPPLEPAGCDACCLFERARFFEEMRGARDDMQGFLAGQPGISLSIQCDDDRVFAADNQQGGRGNVG